MSIEGFGQDETTSGLTALTSGAIDAKGNWSQLIASSGQACEWMTVSVKGSTGKETFLLDIGTGATPAVVVGDICLYGPPNGGQCNFTIPVQIASGTEISARVQATKASAVIEVALHIHDDTSYGTSTSNIPIGVNTGSSQGTDMDAGGTAHTKGAWVELDASTSEDVDWLLVKMDISDNNVQSTASFLIDIGTGSGPVVVLIPNIGYGTDSFEQINSTTFVIKETIAAGTKVSARMQSDIIDASDRIQAVSIIGFNMTAPAGGGGGQGISQGLHSIDSQVSA